MSKGVLPKSFLINEKYQILLFIKTSTNAETYRVKGSDGKLYVLKLFSYLKLHRSAFDESGEIIEISILKKTNHSNIVKYIEDGEIVFDGKKYAFLILGFVPGETLTERITREPLSSFYDLKLIINGVLEGLRHLHTLPDTIIHNEITPQNIMIDLSGNSITPKIIDFGYARAFHKTSKNWSKEGLNLNFVASECFNNFYSPQSDLYSVGALMHHLIFGLPPWFRDVSKFQADRIKAEEIITIEREKPLQIQEIPERFIDVDNELIKVLKKALQQDPEDRFQSAEEFIKALNGEIDFEEIERKKKVESSDSEPKKVNSKKAKGKGFDAIAGMDELKAQLKLDVIDALNNPEEYSKYGVTMPNGMLLYGPPGCGKTFFAKHFAEEVGYNFMLATPSTLKSRFVNATQENIAKMFEEAEKNAPTIIFIDEINELLPNRDSDAHEMSKSAVNEMLAQMDRTGEKGIFIIGATNYPEMIDPAILRAGRLDKKFYLSPPDFEARKAMFKMHLKNRPLDFGIDYKKLAELTENYVSSDIEFLVNESSREALKSKSRVTMKILNNIIQNTKPSVTLSELKKYDKFKSKLNSEKEEGQEKPQERNRIGFK